MERTEALWWLYGEPEARTLGLTLIDLDHLVQQREVRRLFWRDLQLQDMEEAA